MKLFKASLTEVYNLILESKNSELQSKNILSRLNLDSNTINEIIENLKKIDTSQNQKNLPAMAYFAANQGTIIYEDLASAFNKYNDLLSKNRISPIELGKDGVRIEGHNCDNVNCFDWKLNEIYNSHPSEEDSMEIEVPDEDPIFSNEYVDIYDGNDVGQCIKYTTGFGLTDKNYQFCIGQKRNNRHQSYRDLYTSTFYYILDKTKDLNDPLHLVVYDYSRNGVNLTDENNTTGTIAEFGNDVHAYQKYLDSLGVPVERLLVHRPYSDEEEYEVLKLQRKNKDLEWFKSLSYKEKKRYIGRGHELSDEQFNFLIQYKSKELLQDYADAEVVMNTGQLERLNKNLLTTYFRRRIQQFDAHSGYGIVAHELKYMSPQMFKEYVKTGVKKGYWELPQTIKDIASDSQLHIYYKLYFETTNHVSFNEIEELDGNLQALYIERVVRGDSYLNADYFFKLKEEAQERYYELKSKVGEGINLNILQKMPERYRTPYFKLAIEQGRYMGPEERKLMPKELFGMMWLQKIKSNAFISKEDILALPKNLQIEYLKKKMEDGDASEYDIKGMDDDIQLMYYEWALDNSKWISSSKVEEFPHRLKKKYWVSKIKNKGHISKEDFAEMSPDIKEAVILAKIENGDYISKVEMEAFSPELKAKYMEHEILNTDRYFTYEELKELPDDLKIKYYKKMIENDDDPYLRETELISLPKALIKKYLDKKITNGKMIFSHEEELLSKKQKLQIAFNSLINDGMTLEDDEFEKAPLKIKRKHIQVLIDDDLGLDSTEFKYASEKQKWETIKLHLKKGRTISGFEEHMSDKMKERAVELKNNL
jgi:predicted transcriptional regulator